MYIFKICIYLKYCLKIKNNALEPQRGIKERRGKGKEMGESLTMASKGLPGNQIVIKSEGRREEGCIDSAGYGFH